MKCIVFDSGPLISLAMNAMLPIIPKLKKRYGGDFYITTGVAAEIVDQPILSKRFSFEALTIRKLVREKEIDVVDTKDFAEEIQIITTLVNEIYSIRGNNLKILNRGEIEALIVAKNLEADALVVDERTTRVLLENPYRLKKLLGSKFRAKVEINKENLKEFERHFSTLKIIRSVELALVAMERGFFGDLDEDLVELARAILWALKLSGCAVSEKEIKKLLKMYEKKALARRT